MNYKANIKLFLLSKFSLINRFCHILVAVQFII
jgi:hypothetical protein